MTEDGHVLQPDRQVALRSCVWISKRVVIILAICFGNATTSRLRLQDLCISDLVESHKEEAQKSLETAVWYLVRNPEDHQAVQRSPAGHAPVA